MHLRTIRSERGFDLDTLTREADAVADALKSDAKIAADLGDAGAIALAQGRADAAKKLTREAASALKELVSAEEAAAAAEAALEAATMRVNAGTLDASQAVQDESARVVALASVRAHKAVLSGQRVAVRGPLARIAGMTRDPVGRARAAVVASSLSWAEGLFTEHLGSDWARSQATEEGKKADASAEVWYALGEELARRAFAVRKEARRVEFQREYGAIQLMRVDPAPEELERAFACRRAGLEQARAVARAAVAKLEGAA